MVRNSIPNMAKAYQDAVAKMKSGIETIREASEILKAAFGSRYGSNWSIRNRMNNTALETDERAIADFELAWRKEAWDMLVDRLELKRVCSVSRAAEIDKQLSDPKTLPEITEATMVAMIEGNATNIGDFIQEAVVEIFESFRPWREHDSNRGFKTNEVFEIGERVCLNGYVENRWGGGFRLSYYSDRTQRIRCLDNIMHLLDGKGTVPNHAGPLVSALNSEENKGRVETEYFEARCFKKGSLHLRFKRLDLLAELNRRGSGGAPQLPGSR